MRRRDLLLELERHDGLDSEEHRPHHLFDPGQALVQDGGHLCFDNGIHVGNHLGVDQCTDFGHRRRWGCGRTWSWAERPGAHAGTGRWTRIRSNLFE